MVKLVWSYEETRMRLGRSLLYSGPREEGSPPATQGHRGRHQGRQKAENRNAEI